MSHVCCMFVCGEQVLNDEVGGKPSDLWSLGCIVYQMLTGHVPFRGESEYLTFQLILKGEMPVFPPNFDPIARNLIEGLLVSDPARRLTSDEAKNHPFFENIDFENLTSQAAPEVILPVSKGKPRLSIESNDSDILALTEETDQMELSQEKKNEIKKKQEDVKTRMKWQPFLLDNEEIVFTSLVTKGRGIFKKKRQLILTDFPRFVYVDVGSMAISDEIQWSPALKADLKSTSQFVLHTSSSKESLITSLSSPANLWVQSINRLKEQLAE